MDENSDPSPATARVQDFGTKLYLGLPEDAGGDGRDTDPPSLRGADGGLIDRGAGGGDDTWGAGAGAGAAAGGLAGRAGTVTGAGRAGLTGADGTAAGLRRISPTLPVVCGSSDAGF